MTIYWVNWYCFKNFPSTLKFTPQITLTSKFGVVNIFSYYIISGWRSSITGLKSTEKTCMKDLTKCLIYMKFNNKMFNQIKGTVMVTLFATFTQLCWCDILKSNCTCTFKYSEDTWNRFLNGYYIVFRHSLISAGDILLTLNSMNPSVHAHIK